ncbi:hypothetical protein BH09DEP1_BH09DEP1_0630 [soil metagenome]
MQIIYLLLALVIPALSSASQAPLISYLQLLPDDVVHIQLNRILTDKPLWQDDQESTRTEHAIAFSTVFQKICGSNLHTLIISRMRVELGKAKKELLEPFEIKDMNWFEAFLEGKIPVDPPPKKSALPMENPKLFQKLLPFKSLMHYCQIDQEWLKDFLVSKQCGGTLRKHIFINAMKYRHEYLITYLWNKKYRRKIIGLNTRKRSFLAMARDVAQKAGYEIIHEECKSAEHEIREKIKAAQVYYPG